MIQQQELINRRRVRLTTPINGGTYAAGDTGYLLKIDWLPEWGVVFDKDGDDARIRITGRNTDGKRITLINYVEYIQPTPDDDAADLCPNCDNPLSYPDPARFESACCYLCGWNTDEDAE